MPATPSGKFPSSPRPVFPGAAPARPPVDGPDTARAPDSVDAVGVADAAAAGDSAAEVRPAGSGLRFLADLIFWVFAGAGTAILSAWILVPEYLDYCAVLEEAGEVRREVARLDLRNRQYMEVLESLGDREFLERSLLARAAARRSASADPSAPPVAEIADVAPELRLPEPSPAQVREQLAKFPGPTRLHVEVPPRWLELFRDQARRPVLLAIAIGCLTVAFAFFAPQHRPSPARG